MIENKVLIAKKLILLLTVLLVFILLSSSCTKKRVMDLNNTIDHNKKTHGKSNKNINESTEKKEQDLNNLITTKETNTKKDSSKEQQSNNIENRNQAKDNPYVVLEENTPWCYKYYSPNKKKFIKQEVYKIYDLENYYILKLSLNDNIELDNIKIMWNVEMISSLIEWIDDNRVLINGTYIYNILNGEKEYIDFKGYVNKENETFVNYSCLNTKKDKIALTTGGIPQRLLLYDLNSKELKLLKTINKKYYYNGNINEVFWDSDDNIYINAFQLSIHENEIIPASYCSNFIFKYCSKNKIITLYKKDSKIGEYIDDFNCFVYLNDYENYSYSIVDIKNKSILFNFNGFKSDDFRTKQVAYEMDESLLAFFNTERNKINFYSFESNSLISSTDLSVIISKGFYIDYLCFNNKHLNFYVYENIESANSGKIYTIKY
jgi:hypothetical protein